MFNPFKPAAQNTAPGFGFNPSASSPLAQPFGGFGAGDASNAKKNAANSPFASAANGQGSAKPGHPFAAVSSQSENEPKQRHNPFAKNDGHSSDGGKSKSKRKASPAPNSKPSQPTTKKLPNGRLDAKLKPPPEDSRNAAPGGNNRVSPSPSSAASESDTHVSMRSNDPHAKKVYEQLRKDGISPPQWPSQPGQPRNKAAMAKFRDSYESYRTKVRASLTKAGMIDDPDKRKTLKDAIPFKGICEDMCPEFEKITRITEFDINYPEKNPRTAIPNTKRMVKKLARSAAGQEAPLPMDVRSVPALKRTLDYLIDNLLRNDGNLPVVHGFLWDRTRAIRRDFTFFSSLTAEELKIQVYVLENIVRFHVTALHLLTQAGKAPEDFVEQQELEQLGKALLSLRDVYDDSNAQGIKCENEAEFRAYYLIFHAHDPNIMEILQRQWSPRLWRESDEIRTAVSLVEAMQNTQDFHGPLKDAPSMAASSAYHSYFRIVEDPQVSYTMACFAECHFPRIRRSILAAVKKALARPKETAKDVTAAVLNRFLRFDTVQEAIDFANLHDLEFSPDSEAPSDLSRQYLVLNNRSPLPHPRLQHQFSRDLVEKKRGSNSLPNLIHSSVLQNSNSQQDNANGPDESSLFVPQESYEPNKPLGGSGFQQATSIPQASLGKPSEAKSPFAPDSKPQVSVPPMNPFAPKSAVEASAPQPKPPSSTPAFTNPFAAGSGNQEPSTQPKSVFGETKHASSQIQLGGRPAQPASQADAPAVDSVPKPPSFGSASPFGQAPKLPTPATGAPVFGSTAPASTPVTAAPTTNSSAIPTSATPRSMFPIPPQATRNPTAPSPNFPATSLKPTVQPAAEVPSLLAQPSNSASSTSLAPSALPQPAADIARPSLESMAQPKQPSPPRDILGDFTKWFVQGDNGLLEEFQVFMVENMLKDLFTTFKKKEEKRLRKEEEDRDNAAADKFRIYNLSLRMFYRWRDNARKKRLKQLRRTGREQARAFYEAQRAAELKARKEAAQEKEKEKARPQADRPKELMSMLKRKKASKTEAEQALLASGVLSGVADEREAIASIVRREYDLPAPPSGRSTRSPSISSVRAGGTKTKALRESLLGADSSSFRRSLPPMSSRDSASPDTASRTSKVSERWRLKAMGIVQLSDGTAVPESLANDMAYGAKNYSELSSAPYDSSSRRASISSMTRPDGRRVVSQSKLAQLQGSYSMGPPSNVTPVHKRKRLSDDDGAAAKQGGGQANSHKRVMSDAENLVNELRTLREEMEEGATWFKSQNERLQSDIMSRGSTPWDDSN